MQPYFADHFYNPSALYRSAQDVKLALTTARTEVAAVLGCKTTEVIFTAGGTESANLAIRGVMEAFVGKSCVISALEHDAVMMPARRYPYRLVPATTDGLVAVNDLVAAIDDTTVLVSLMYVNNEIGTVQPLRAAALKIKQIRDDRKTRGVTLPLYFHADACQAANYLPLLTNQLGVDLMTLNGGKIYGPKQSGMLFVRTGVQLQPQVVGGGQERGLRSGTENVAAIIGFAAALKETNHLRETERHRLSELQHDFITKLALSHPSLIINGSLQHRLPNNIHCTFPGLDNERLMMELDEQGVMVATGSACSASSDEPSHVLAAIGLTDAAARSSLRITLGRQTNKQGLTKLHTALTQLVAR